MKNVINEIFGYDKLNEGMKLLGILLLVIRVMVIFKMVYLYSYCCDVV